MKQFKISAFSSTVIYKGTKKTLQEIASELNVSLILSGSSRIFGDSVRLSIELVDPKSKNRIWNKRYDDELSNALRIQNDIAKQVVNELNIELSPEEIKDLDKIATHSPEAFDLLLQAKAAYIDLSKDGSLKSIKMLEHAIELDPDYAQAYTLLAWIHILNGFAEVIPDAGLAVNTVAKARPLIDKSISLDPSISDNYLIMGALDLFYLNNLPSAFENVEKALKMSSWPKVPTNYCICTAISVFAALGELSEATDLVKLSKKTDLSNNFVFSDEGLVLLLKGEPEKAIYAFKQAAEFNEIPYFNYNIGWTYYHIREFEEALLYLDEAFVGEKEPLGNVLAFLSNTHFKMGNIEMSEYYRNLMLKRRSNGKANLMIPLAMVSAGRGNTEDALHFLEQAYKEKEYGFAWFLNIDPVFDELKSNAAFIELVNRIGFEQN